MGYPPQVAMAPSGMLNQHKIIMMTASTGVSPPFDAPIFPIALLDLAEKFYERRKQSLGALYKRCKITEAQISRSDAHITGWQFRELLRSCKEIAMPSPPLSVQLAEFIPITIPGGMFGLASFTAKTVQQALEVMTDFSHTVMPAFQFERLMINGRCHVVMRPQMDFEDVQHELEEAICGYLLNLRHFAQLSAPPVQVHFAHTLRGNIEDYENYFGAKYLFSQKTTEVIFEKHHLIQPLYTHNQATFDQVYNSLKSTSEPESCGSTSKKVKQILMQRLAQGQTTNITQITEDLHVSERTLARRLRQENHSFVELKQQVSIDYAKYLLGSTEQPICKIAQACGYNSDSNFSRAFKHSTGQSPKQYRSGA
jgi:AraC-like DNA-binding protein